MDHAALGPHPPDVVRPTPPDSGESDPFRKPRIYRTPFDVVARQLLCQSAGVRVDLARRVCVAYEAGIGLGFSSTNFVLGTRAARDDHIECQEDKERCRPWGTTLTKRIETSHFVTGPASHSTI